MGQIRKGADILRAARQDQGLAQAQLAAILSVSVRTVRRWEAGDSMPNAAQFGALRVVLHLHVTTWLSDAERERLLAAWGEVKTVDLDQLQKDLTKDKYYGGER